MMFNDRMVFNDGMVVSDGMMEKFSDARLTLSQHKTIDTFTTGPASTCARVYVFLSRFRGSYACQIRLLAVREAIKR